MVAVKNSEAERFVKAPPPAIFLFLVYGPDAGLVRERATKLACARVDDRRDPFQCAELSGDAVAADPLLLLDEAHTVPLFGGRRIIVVETGSKSVAPALERLIAAPPPEHCSVIVTAPDLKRDAPLRKLVEGARSGAAIACYPDAEQDLDALIDAALREASLTIAPEARGLLRSALGEDRLASRAELSKLALYARDKERIEASDVEDIVALGSNVAADRLAFEAFSGKASGAGEAFDHALAKGGDAGQVIASALRYALALHRARLAVDRERRVEAGVGLLLRAGFGFVPRPVVESHLSVWPAARIETLFEPLRASLKRARAHGETASMEAARALLRIAHVAAAPSLSLSRRRRGTEREGAKETD